MWHNGYIYVYYTINQNTCVIKNLQAFTAVQDVLTKCLQFQSKVTIKANMVYDQAGGVGGKEAEVKGSREDK